jgi:hypothetical protein
MSDERKSHGFVHSLLLLAGGVLGAWALTKQRPGSLSTANPRHGMLSEQERADFARRHTSTEQALQVMEDYGADPMISFDVLKEAVRRVEQDAVEDYRQLQQVIRREQKSEKGEASG